jgi:hypothetical protein
VREKVTDFRNDVVIVAGSRYNSLERGKESHMNESIVEMQRLLKEIVGHLQADMKADKRKALPSWNAWLR